MRSIIVLFIAALAALPAGSDPAGFALWKGSQLRGYGKKLAPKISAQKVASERLGAWDNHLVMVVHREGDGEAELHEKLTDIFVVQSGEATLVVGGTVVNGRTTAPGEIRGPSIQGGQKKPLAPGDIAHIPARIAHQVLVENGKQFTYAIVKVEE
jgi:mannose-6-phosphate isomerase-like protein (cupin superfamily)